MGKGDSQLVNLTGGVQILIDGGQPNSEVLSELAKVLPANDSYIDLIVMTHPQLDHFGGLIDVLKKYEVGVFLSTGRKGEIDAYSELIKVLKARDVPYIIGEAGDVIRHEDASFSVLSPKPQNLLSKELNDTSLVMLLESRGLKALYTGDIGFSVEKQLVKERDLQAQILKVPHHGSRFSSSEEFLNEVKPQIAVIGVGKNSYGHPTSVALDRLQNSGSQVFTTEKNGTIKLVLQGEKVLILAEKPDAGVLLTE